LSVTYENLDVRRLNLVFILMIGLSVVIGVFAGAKTTLSLKMMFYAIVLTNALMIAYLFLLKKMTYGLILYFYALVFLNFYWRIPLTGKLPDLDVPRIIFLFFWIVFLVEVGLGNRRLLPRTAAELAMLATVGAIVFSMFQYSVLRIRLLLNGFAIPYAMFMLSKNAFVTRDDLKKFLYFAAVPLSVYFPVNHFFERLGMTKFVFPRYILSAELGGRTIFAGQRTIGAFLQPVATGFALICMFILSLYALSKLKGFLPRLAMGILCMMTPLAVFVIYTRSVYLGFFIAMTILAVFGKRLRTYAIVIIVITVLAVMANWENVTTANREAGGLAAKTSALGRLVLLETSLRMFMDHPFTGVGFEQYEVHRLPYVRQVRTTLLGARESWMGKNVKQHNQFLLLLTELGLMGFVPLCLVYYFILRLLWKARKIHDDTYDYEFVVVVWAILAEYLTNIMFMNPAFYEFLNVMPMVLAGIVIGGYQRATLGGWKNNAKGERSLARESTIR
jgi:O-antigen ligase